MCNNIMVNMFTKKKISMLYTADMTMSYFDNFDIDQISSKFAQRQYSETPL